MGTGNVLEDLPDVVLPILNAEYHHSAMDIVKWLSMFPVFFNIINNETNVGRDTRAVSGKSKILGYSQSGLNWREVNPDDLCS
jgi:hypothetical protein